MTNCALAESGLGHDKLAKLLIDVALKYMRKDYAGIDTNDIVGKISSISSYTNNDVAKLFEPCGRIAQYD